MKQIIRSTVILCAGIIAIASMYANMSGKLFSEGTMQFIAIGTFVMMVVHMVEKKNETR